MVMRTALIGVLLLVSSAASAAGIAPRDLKAEITSFYKAPSAGKAAQIFEAFAKSDMAENRSSHPPMAGFLAGAFIKYPKDIDRIIPRKLDDMTTYTVALALRFSGQSARSTKLLDALIVKGFMKPQMIESFPTSLDSYAPTTSTDFDILWGASFATGDARYVAKVMERYASVAKDETTTNALLTVAKTFVTRGDLEWMHEKYSEEERATLINTATALWELDSNAQQHEFVRDYISGYMKAHPGDFASKGLLCEAKPDCKAVADLSK
ncbi:MAG: hypothetical protein ACXWM1_12710 [Candidatus Binataceae bacterium]